MYAPIFILTYLVANCVCVRGGGGGDGIKTVQLFTNILIWGMGPVKQACFLYLLFNFYYERVNKSVYLCINCEIGGIPTCGKPCIFHYKTAY